MPEPESGYSDEGAHLNVAGFFARHLVGIYSAYSDGSCDMASGFIMEVVGRWLLVTAGHVIGDLNRSLAEKKLTKVRLLDGFGHQARSKVPYPFVYETAGRTIVGDQNEIDYGMILLDEWTTNGLKVNNIVPMDEEHWRNPPPDGFHQLMLIGLPSEFAKVTKDISGEPMISGAKVIFAVLEPVENPPEELRSSFRRIYARIPGDFDAGGMSGGLVIGMRRLDGKNKYWPIGIQSGWQKSSRTLTILPFKVFADSVHRNLRAAVEKLDRGVEP